MLLDDKDAVASATTLLKKIGVIGAVGGAAIGTVFGYLKWKNGRQVEKVENSGSNNVIVHVHGAHVPLRCTVLSRFEGQTVLPRQRCRSWHRHIWCTVTVFLN
jgi:hypothetical protein